MLKNLHFAPPIAPLPSIAASWLSGQFSNLNNFSDISDSIFILPTRSAARLLRSEFLRLLDNRNISAIGGLDIITPEIFIDSICATDSFANIFESSSAWFLTFKAAEISSLRALFPNGAPERVDFPFLADKFTSMRRMLAEAGLTALALADILAGTPDAARWRDIADLERIYIDILQKRGLKPSESAPITALQKVLSGDLSENLKKIKHIYIIGVPDPSPQFAKILEAFENITIDILTFADKNDEKYFDEWGRPRSNGDFSWVDRNLEIDLSNISVVADLRGQSDVIADLADRYGAEKVSRICSIACDEGDSLKLIMGALASKKIDSYSPEGRSLGDFPQIEAVGKIGEFIEDSSVENLFAMLRNPVIADYVERRTSRKWRDFIAAIDSLAQDTLFDSLESGLALCVGSDRECAKDTLTAIDSLIKKVLAQKTASEALDILFAELFAVSDMSETNLGADASEASADIYQFLESFTKSFMRSGDIARELSLGDAVKLLISDAKKRFQPPSKTVGSVALLDWIEVFWSQQPHIILADMNEGIVPQKVSEDFFLPDFVKSKLAIRDSKSRRARDAWMLYTLLKSRREGGAVSVIVPRRRLKEPVYASGLLFQCADENLANSVDKLFALPENASANYPFQASWKLKVRFANLPEKISVSAFKAYIECPFNFYLSYILKADTVDIGNVELGRDKIGTLIHAILENFIKSEHSDTDDEVKTRQFLDRYFEEITDKFYGQSRSAALMFQLNSLRGNLLAVAGHLAQLRAQGYKTLATEKYLSNLKVGDFKVSMRIDRIDEDASGKILVIDYKTKDTPKSTKTYGVAEYAHRHEVVDEGGGKVVKWFDLQLPLYVAALREIYPNRKIECAHFIISRDPSVSGLYTWEIDDAAISDALLTAEQIAKNISERNFKPAKKRPLFGVMEDMFAFDADELESYLEFENEK